MQVKGDKHHPDRDILCEFSKTRRFYDWTPKETDSLIEGIKKHGKDYKTIKKAFENRTIRQIANKVTTMLKQISEKPDHKHAKHASVLNKISIRGKHVWTDKQ